MFGRNGLENEKVSISQVWTRNSERRRRALVSNCACIRLESAMSTPMALEVAADEGRIKQLSKY